jgi:hypothetical protein
VFARVPAVVHDGTTATSNEKAWLVTAFVASPVARDHVALLLSRALAVAAELRVPVHHETHRHRVLFAPFLAVEAARRKHVNELERERARAAEFEAKANEASNVAMHSYAAKAESDLREARAFHSHAFKVRLMRSGALQHSRLPS